MVIAIAIRWLDLDQPIRLDEKLTYVHFASRPWLVALSDYSMPNNHIFHTLLVKLSTGMMGFSLLSLRLPAFIAGVLVVPATYVAVRLLYGAPSALIATALVAGSQEMIDYATNGRGYSLMTLAFVTLVIIAARLQTSPSMKKWLAFVIVATLGLWTIPVMLLPLGAVATWLAASAVRRKASRDLRQLGAALLATAGLTGLCYAPVVAYSGLAALAGNEYVTASPWPVFLAELLTTAKDTLWYWSRSFPSLFGYAFALCAVLALASHGRVSRWKDGMPIAAVAWCLLFLLLNHRAPPVRVWQWGLPLAAGLVGAGLVRIVHSSSRLEAFVAPRLAPLAVTLGGVGAIGVWAAR
jgi:Dolichyl-phosphate-mannose-protein mannosyltransferase